MTREQIAQICHEANRALCLTLGDTSQLAWADAPEWQRSSALSGVTAIAEGRINRPEQSHESWSAEKLAAGWQYGPIKNADTKEHPCLVPFAELPEDQRAKDVLFFAVAESLCYHYADRAPAVS